MPDVDDFPHRTCVRADISVRRSRKPGAGTGSKPSNGVDVEDPYLIVGSPLVVTNNPSLSFVTSHLRQGQVRRPK